MAQNDVCGKWMRRAKEPCARKPGHKGDCRTAKALDESKRRLTERRRGVRRRDDPAAVKLWRRSHKFVRLGITEDDFDALLSAQGYACATCQQAFGDNRRIFADHDHACCPMTSDQIAKTCGKCIRGLLCFRCNTALGYVEKYGDMAKAYLAAYAARRVGDTGIEPVASSV